MSNIVFIRFGDPPDTGRSRNNLTGFLEDGMSVYEAIEKDGKINIILPNWEAGACVTLSSCFRESAYLVEGDVVGHGSEGEPLLSNYHIIKKVQHQVWANKERK